MTQLLPKLIVLTPKLTSKSNEYLKLLWSSVEKHNIEIKKLNWSQSVRKIYTTPKEGDICHFHWVHELCNFGEENKIGILKSLFSSILKLCIIKLKKYRIIWTVHNTLSHESISPKIEGFFRLFMSWICDDILVMSEHGQQEFLNLYGRKKRIHIVPHGNYINVYPNAISRDSARQRLGISSEKKVILHLGRLMKYKGISSLVSSFNQIEDVNALLLIAGSCSDHELAEEIEIAMFNDSRIIFHNGFIPDNEIQLYMNACDWVVFPFSKILNSGSVMLALSFGKPVIVRQQGALSDLIVNGRTGYCYYDEAELRDTLNIAFSTLGQDRDEMCSQAYHLAQKYDWSQIGLELSNIYRQYR